MVRDCGLLSDSAFSFPSFSVRLETKRGTKERRAALFLQSPTAGSWPRPGLLALSPLFLPLLQRLSCPTFWVTGSAVGSFINYDSLAVSNGLQMEPPVESPQGYWQRLKGDWKAKGKHLLNVCYNQTKQVGRNKLSPKDSCTFSRILT